MHSGAVFTKHNNSGGANKRFIKVSLDWQTLTWSDPKEKEREEKSLPCRFIKLVTAGACTPALLKQPMLGKSADPENSLAIFDTRAPTWSLSLEATTSKEAQDWVNALQLLRDAFLNFHVGF